MTRRSPLISVPMYKISLAFAAALTLLAGSVRAQDAAADAQLALGKTTYMTICIAWH